MKQPHELVIGEDVLNCPCCGGPNLSIGRMTASTYGIECFDCGLEMAKTPSNSHYKYMPESLKRTTESLYVNEAVEWLRLYTVHLAIKAWNRRAPIKES